MPLLSHYRASTACPIRPSLTKIGPLSLIKSPWLIGPGPPPAKLSVLGRSLWSSLFNRPSHDTHINSGVDDDERSIQLGLTLGEQDPKGRICFERPNHQLLDTQPANGKLHLVPFWNLNILLEVWKEVIDKDTGDTVIKYDYPSCWTEMGVSIAAVGEKHFASGLILSEDLRGNHTILDGLHTHSTTLPRFNSQIPRSDSFTPYTPRGPPSAVRFAFAPPTLMPRELEVLSNAQATRFDHESAKHLKQNIKLKASSTIVYAVPSYRYILEFPAFLGVDIFMTNQDRFSRTPGWLTAGAPSKIVYLEQAKPFGFYRNGFDPITMKRENVVRRYMYPPDTVYKVKQAITDDIARSRSDGLPRWNRNGIIGMTGEKGLDEALKLGEHLMFSAVNAQKGGWLREVRPTRKIKPRPPPSATNQASSSEATFPKPTVFRQHREAAAKSSTAPHTQAAQSSRPSPRPARHHPPPITTSPVPTTPTPAPPRAKTVYKPIPDPRNYYRTLGILSPDTRYIHEHHSAAWDRIIQQRYRRQSADNHPDLFPDPEEKKRQSLVQMDLNATREALETLSLRQAYK